MNLVSLHQFLALYTWLPVAMILALMLLIGRFYQRFSGQRTYFWYYAALIALFAVLYVRIASQHMILTDVPTNLIASIAGISLLALSLRLYFCMLIDNKKN